MTNEKIKPILVVSKCLGDAKCRYNGQAINDDFVKSLQPYVSIIETCPEVEIGLGIPRDPIRIAIVDGVHKLYQPATGLDCTEKMLDFTENFLENLPEPDGFILKNRSPSCGPFDCKIYQGMEKSARSERGSGFFGGAVLEKYKDVAVEDEGRLKNFSIRQSFLTRIFANARLRKVIESNSMGKLMEFHASCKYLMMGYNQTKLRMLGKIVANQDKKTLDEVFNFYKTEFNKALYGVPKRNSMINVLEHIMGGMKKQISSGEKQFFLNSIEEYRDERIPLSAVLYILRTWITRFEVEYLLKQVLFEPYPIELMQVTDSGKGRIGR